MRRATFVKWSSTLRHRNCLSDVKHQAGVVEIEIIKLKAHGCGVLIEPLRQIFCSLHVLQLLVNNLISPHLEKADEVPLVFLLWIAPDRSGKGSLRAFFLRQMHRDAVLREHLCQLGGRGFVGDQVIELVQRADMLEGFLLELAAVQRED